MRICVFGAGAVGGNFAACLAEGGATVSVVARGAHLAAIQSRGLILRGPNGVSHTHPAASEDPAELGPQDAVLVTVKAPALPDVAARIGPLLGPRTPVVFAMNGIPWWYFYAHGGALDGRRLPLLDPGDALWAAVGPERAIGGVIYAPCTVVEPGVIERSGGGNTLVLGEPDGSISDRLGAIAGPLRAGGVTVEVTAAIRDAIWRKLVLNLASGPLCVLSQSALSVMYQEPACAEAARRVMAEASAIASAMGCRAELDADAQIARSRALPHKPSMLQDIENGRPMEIDAWMTAPLEMARMTGVATPMLDMLAALVRLRAAAAGLYPTQPSPRPASVSLARAEG